MTLPAGTRIGRYEIVACAGSGGMGEVYRARDTLLERVVALKMLPAGSAAQDALASEARTVAGLSHPHIGALHDVGEHEGRLFLVMEYIEGDTLRERIRRGSLPLDEALGYARDLAEALDAAHQKGIVHRDLKPSNVVLTRSGAKLVDFGIAVPARAGPGEHTLTKTGEPASSDWSGTVAYMAPERLRGERGDARSDIFSLGVVVYEMLAGKRPFAGDNDAQLAAAIVSADPAPIAGVPPPVHRLMNRCLAKDPAARWQTASDLAEALNFVPDRTAPRDRMKRRSRLRLVALAAVATAIVVLAARQAARSALPVVVLMDSTLPERVYDPETRSAGATNSDDITDALRGLPVLVLKEPTSAIWHREEQVLRERPALVMMHLSSFAAPNATHESDLQAPAVERTREFLAFVGTRSPLTTFVIYTRGRPAASDRAAWISETEERFPELRGRLQMVHVPGDEKATFRDPAVKKSIRELVITTLGLSATR
ncbi:MAG: serine/threonine-protein kinase [Myxococcales bacterium]